MQQSINWKVPIFGFQSDRQRSSLLSPKMLNLSQTPNRILVYAPNEWNIPYSIRAYTVLFWFEW